MKIQIASDLHLEFGMCSIPNMGADVLVLAGDIAEARNFHKPEYLQWWEQVCSSFDKVIAVAGNHEYYKTGWHKTHHILHELAAQHINLHYLNCGVLEMCGVRFLGCTLWTDLDNDNPLTHLAVGRGMNDYRAIRHDTGTYKRLSTNDTLWEHKQHLGWLNTELTPGCVVITHHAPSYRSVSTKYRGDTLNAAFASNLDDWILYSRNQPQLWIHGHLHDPVDYHIGRTRVVSNPRGYHGYEHNPFNPVIVEV